MNTAEIIKTMRVAAGFTVRQLAARIGTDSGHVSRWETGKVRPTADYLFAAAEACGYEVIIKPKYNRQFYLQEKEHEQAHNSRKARERSGAYTEKK